MCLACESDDKKFSCCGGCGPKSCMGMCGANCGAATMCVYCPLAHIYHGCHHCRLCCTSTDNLEGDKLEKHHELEEEDKCFGGNHKCGAICCPCTSLCCVVGVGGCAATYVASFFCCVAGTTCKGIVCCMSCAYDTCPKVCCCCVPCCCCCFDDDDDDDHTVTEQP